MKKILASIGIIGALCCAALGASIANFVSYPSFDSGWTKTGNVTPVSCAGAPNCVLTLPDNNGNPTSFTHSLTNGFLEPVPSSEDLQVTSNGGNSFVNALVNLPSTQNYTIVAQVYGQQGPAFGTGTLVYPKAFFDVGGGSTQVGKYPNGVSITPTTFLTVNNANHNIPEYMESVPTQLFAGNNTVGISILGGRGQGGSLFVRHLVIYPTSQGLLANVGCLVGSTWHTTQLSGTDIQALNTAARSYANSNCGTGVVAYVNLRNGVITSSGCSGNTCAMLELD